MAPEGDVQPLAFLCTKWSTLGDRRARGVRNRSGRWSGERALGVGVIWSVSAARANRFARELIRVCVRSGGGVRERTVAVITFVRHVQFW